ncbi:Chitosanase-domain-containing protein [Aspergillus costaricaensis CBS 115574]|uniref:Chitosanase-domain-containing protein n=1 Tax=Aspergillus costaricaensis CBS 115574 TaxID=1448317 RepID=A0ACD1IA55_9EURO|nr:Chitosanase-domain-containing protein [Aspergillus costaricaensis CBS 115574]RAK87213.1 Chitosanase-domain-containing protein [Aspergillus costaricaensis CBS 115574]
MAFKTTAGLALLALAGSVKAQSVDGSKYNSPTNGPPASYFAAATTLPVAALQSAAAKASSVPSKATYPVNTDKNSPKSTIHSDWVKFNQGAALSWVADMDVDCDGIDYKCKGNGDGLPETNWGALSAYEVPWIVIPDQFLTANEDLLPGNNVAAVICNGKMYYGILGDSNGDDPEVTGEASWLMARTCFPDDDLNGAEGHAEADVTYIVFTGDDAVLPSSALDKNYITNFSTLRSMGDKLVGALASNLGLSKSGSGSGSSASASVPSQTTLATSAASTPSPSGSTATCSWEGHCEGAICSTEDDCSDDLVCDSGKCSAAADDEDDDEDDEDDDDDDEEDEDDDEDDE